MHKDFQSKFMPLKGWLLGMAFAVLTACGGGGSSSPTTAVGMSDNYRDLYNGINPSTGKTFNAPGVYNSGNFILFEK